ncbi:hypothetical protein GDO86_007903 [Hymenochirus boettgeri]|uniref:Uncharacterized protein n=1 Tax=Hymenochirus boettgeri TaxID=247094 RepID=A0A8T2J2T8_9PIPI|nr:hypothetical protein GDO86_007903 [Hymenochirus boettgeri]
MSTDKKCKKTQCRHVYIFNSFNLFIYLFLLNWSNASCRALDILVRPISGHSCIMFTPILQFGGNRKLADGTTMWAGGLGCDLY